MTCPLKMFNNSEHYYILCESDCAFNTETGCLLAEGLKTYIDIHKPVKVEIESEQDKKEEISKLINVLSKIPISNYYGIDDFERFII